MREKSRERLFVSEFGVAPLLGLRDPSALVAIHRRVLLRTRCMSGTRASERRLTPLWRGLIAGSMVVAGGLHVDQVQAHLEEWKPAGVFFLVTGLLQVGLGAAFTVGASARLRLAALVVSVPTALLWAASRSVGVPGGPHGGIPEAVDAAGVVATSLELVTITILAAWGSGWVRRSLPLAVRVGALTVLFATVGTAGATGEWTSECGGGPAHAGEVAHASDEGAPHGRGHNYAHASDADELLKNHAGHDVLDSFKRLEEAAPEAPERKSASC